MAGFSPDQLEVTVEGEQLTVAGRRGDGAETPGKDRAYLHRESAIVKALQANGWQVQRNAMTKTRFYFSRLLEATR